jgi:hypothetical protein
MGRPGKVHISAGRPTFLASGDALMITFGGGRVAVCWWYGGSWHWGCLLSEAAANAINVVVGT